jgi:hypothetical protein
LRKGSRARRLSNRSPHRHRATWCAAEYWYWSGAAKARSNELRSSRDLDAPTPRQAVPRSATPISESLLSPATKLIWLPPARDRGRVVPAPIGRSAASRFLPRRSARIEIRRTRIQGEKPKGSASFQPPNSVAPIERIEPTMLHGAPLCTEPNLLCGSVPRQVRKLPKSAALDLHLPSPEMAPAGRSFSGASSQIRQTGDR